MFINLVVPTFCFADIFFIVFVIKTKILIFYSVNLMRRDQIYFISIIRFIFTRKKNKTVSIATIYFYSYIYSFKSRYYELTLHLFQNTFDTLYIANNNK